MSFNAPAQGTIALIVVTATITAIIAVFGRRFAEALLDGILRPFKWLWERIYRWVAPRNPLSISLRSYKKHLRRSWLTKIENPIGPELDVPLEHAFAPLKLISSSSQETIDLFTHVSNHPRCVVLGGPGTGKTTLMKSLVTSVINGRANDTLNSLIPVFVVLRKLAVKQQSVKEAIIAAFADFHFPGADKFVDSALEQGRMLIVLDGLDEVGVNREYVAGQIISFCESDDQLAKRNHLIVTCREYSYRTEDLRSVIKNIVRVEPFANHHMRVFLQGWPNYQGRSALALYGLIQRDSQIRDICRNPLLLTILTGLYLETKNFEFPTSRSLFYKAAIDELITKRPARREIKQRFESIDKWNVLQRVSLTRLETVKVNEDPEELTADGIREQASAVFRTQIDFNEFIKELVEINGIIKPTSDGIYTCAHRTIQEFFAANEAGRIRTPDDVVLRFSDRRDLIEVLYFYCGMLRNIPQLTNIVEYLSGEGRWLEAARCLLSMTEAPAASLVHLVTTELKAQIVGGSEFRPVLEILSSLAQRPEPEFEPARQRFFEAVNYLAGGNEATGASALESALATSPEAAMKVIPGLLKHHAERWQTAAVELLKDIGTEEALDQLVLLLVSDKEFIRTQAAKAIVLLIRTHNKDLKNRAALLPDRKESNIWPVHHLFPSNLAIPIAESLINVPAIGNKAIHCAMSAIQLSRVDSKSAADFVKHWRNVPRDLRLRTRLIKLGELPRKLALVASIFLLVLMVVAELWGYAHDRMLLLEVAPVNLHLVERGSMREVQSTASNIVTTVEQNFPPDASGLSRILPWNWLTDPVIPERTQAGFSSLKRHAGEVPDPYSPLKEYEKLGVVSTLVSTETFEPFAEAVNHLRRDLPVLKSERYVTLQGTLEVLISFGAVIVFWLGFKAFERWFAIRLRSLFPFSFYYAVLPMAFSIPHLAMGSVNMRPIWVVYFGVFVGCFLVSPMIQMLKFPRNPLLVAVDDLTPLDPATSDYDSSSERKRRPLARD